jgi:hypothetical protein
MGVVTGIIRCIAPNVNPLPENRACIRTVI